MNAMRTTIGIAVFLSFLSVPLLSDGVAAEKPRGNVMQLASTAFNEGGPIPARFTCDGSDASPALKWSGLPSEAKSLVLIADDPDAPVGTWVHWVLYDLPASASELPEDAPKSQYLPGGAKQGLNDFKRLWRTLSTRRQATSLFFQVVRVGHAAGSEAGRHEKGG
jgi:phosphatidylethanolamine-binding protein (PEBP) family uncharacterized protein